MSIRRSSSLGRSPWPVRLILLASIWGSSFLLIKVGDEALAPLQVTLGRMLFGAGTLLLLALATGTRLPRERRVWLHLAVAAFLTNALPFALFAYGETRTTSVLASICNATTPLWTLPVAALVIPGERPDRGRLAGVGIGFIGVLIVLGVWQGAGGAAWAGNLACLGAGASYGLGFPYTRRFLIGQRDSILALAAAQLLLGTLELAIVTPLASHAPATLPIKVLLCVALLGSLGTGIAYILNYSIIRDAGPTAASTVTYLVPIFAAVMGVLILGEQITWYEPAGAAIIILGVAVSQGRIRPRTLPPRERVPQFDSSAADARRASSPEWE